jgi:hypothetical protein
MCRPLVPFLLSLLSGCALLSAATNPIMDSAKAKIAAFHAGEKPNGAFVRVVYFHAADQAPLADFQGRLERSLNDISAFYRDEMLQRYGVKTEGLPLERREGKFVLHVVKGKQPSAHYDYSSGSETWNEVKQVLGGKIKPDREHVLIFYGLCEQEADGRYVIHAPYYGAGDSNHQHGLCHAADCEKLDPLLLTRKDLPFVFKEHSYERMKMTVAKFNTWYLGGLAHELGHGLGFPHDSGAPGEASGVALMGGGNLTYRENLWGGTRPAYLSLATALRFATHPLATHSDKARWQANDATVTDLVALPAKGALRLSGRITASVPPCAFIASVWPTTAKTDHGAQTFCSAIDGSGRFMVEITGLKNASYRLKFGSLLVNGAEAKEQHVVVCDADGKPSLRFLSERMVAKAEQAALRDPAKADELLSDRAIISAPDDSASTQLKLLRELRRPQPEATELAKVRERTFSLSDAQWSEAKVAWGKPTRNRFGSNDALLLKVGGQAYAKGLYAHANSRYAYALDANWKSFTASVGLRDGAGAEPSARFIVLGDGKELYRSPAIREGVKQDVYVDVTGVRQLELITESTEQTNRACWALWVEPLLRR